MQFNYVDLIIFLIIGYFAVEALRHGFWILLADFISFLSALLISFRFYQPVAELLRSQVALSYSASKALAFLLTAIILESIIGFLLGFLLRKLPEAWWKHKLNKILGLLPSIGEALVLVSFFLILALSFPIKPSIKTDIEDSVLGGYLLNKTARLENLVNAVFGGVIEDSLTFLTIKPGDKKALPLTVEKLTLSGDKESEQEDLTLINIERETLGINKLNWSEPLAEVARAYATDMWERRFFGHYSPEGKSVADRLTTAKIKYLTVGENLAMAPTVKLAHKGLMNSEGHRANILEKSYSKVGIGVIDNGVYGKMLVQIFSN